MIIVLVNWAKKNAYKINSVRTNESCFVVLILFIKIQVVKNKSAVEKGIKKTVYEMIKVPYPLIGVKGIQWFAKDLKKWSKKYGNETASFYLGQIIRMSEDFGIGGAGFRYIYGAFLEETGEKFNNPDLTTASVMMGNTANRWREFTYLGVRNCKNRSKPEEDYGKLSDMLHEIADMEKEVYSKLDKLKI